MYTIPSPSVPSFLVPDFFDSWRDGGCIDSFMAERLSWRNIAQISFASVVRSETVDVCVCVSSAVVVLSSMAER